MMSLRLLAAESIFRAAVGAAGFAGFQHVEEDARMARPQRAAGLRAMQRQIVGGDGYVAAGVERFTHDESSSGDSGKPVSVARHFAVDHVKKETLQPGGDRAALARADLPVVEFAD